jgi:hypothetical protein
MPCICRICGERFDRLPLLRPGELWAPVCEDCGGFLCPTCRSHDIYDIIRGIAFVPPHLAASVRASVWGRGH